MISKRLDAANPWSPAGFERFTEWYPATEWSPPPPELDRTREFLALWQGAGTEAVAAERAAADVAVVLTPGLFGEWLPRCFSGAKRAFKGEGRRVLLTSVRTSLGVRAQARRLAAQIDAWLQPAERFIWCGHSKGGIEALWALAEHAPLRARCRAAVVVQPPVGYSWVVDKWVRTPDSFRERVLRRLLGSGAVRDGVRDISRSRDAEVSAWLETFAPDVPTLNAVSWSIQPTSWVDSYHGELRALRPGHAHDGQFFLCDQRLPATPLVGLPALDHAQPVLGGYGLDVGRLWRALVSCALATAQTR